MDQKSSSELLSSSCSSVVATQFCRPTPLSQRCRAVSSASVDDANSRPAPDQERLPADEGWELETILSSEAGGRQGWNRLFASVDYFSSLIDIRAA